MDGIQSGKVFRLDGLPGRRVKRQRIDRRPVFPDTEIKMRAGGNPSSPDIADHITLADMNSGLDPFGVTGKMHVGSRVGGVVADLDCVATSIGPASAKDGPVADAHHWRARWSRIINGRVGPYLAGHRMTAVIGETGTDPGKLQRSFQESFTKTGTI